MLRKWCALGVLALVVSPCTSPFRTCTALDPRAASASVLTAPGVADQRDADALVVPRSGESARLKMLAMLGTGPSGVLTLSPIAFLSRLACHVCTGTHTVPPAVLRV